MNFNHTFFITVQEINFQDTQLLDLKLSERVLSNYFNTELVVSFSEWKNNLRIDCACNMIDEGKVNKLTVEGISLNVGFSSRSKFIDAFKARKGVTPSVYIKQIKL